MAGTQETIHCRSCGIAFPAAAPACPLCNGGWEIFELKFPALPLENVSEQIAGWVAALPQPCALTILAGMDGLRVRLAVPPGAGSGSAAAWAALTRQHGHWTPAAPEALPFGPGFALVTHAILPQLDVQSGDPFLAAGARLAALARAQGRPAGLCFWILGREDRLQERLRALFAYATGTEKGVEDDTPNPWSLRLGLWRAVMAAGAVLAALSGAALAPGWVAAGPGLVGLLSGGLLGMVGYLGALRWMQFRSLPASIVEPRMEGALLRVAVSLHAGSPDGPQLLSGPQRWRPLARSWPDVRRHAFPLPAAEIARLFAPLENSEGSGLLARDAVQDVPAPAPSPALVQAPVRIGTAVATGEPVGIEASGHVLVVGGSRTGKSSAVYWTLRRMAEQPEAAPGLFLVDPHGSLADGLLDFIDRLPEPERAAAVRRLQIVTPGEDFVIPLNPLMAPDFSWAGNALVQAGERIWGEFWGPRMQAALLALARLGHAWNRHHPDRPMGLIHAVFAAYDRDWRAEALRLLPESGRLGAAALDALLGQNEERVGPRNHHWVTEVVSPILSKLMSIELSPWLFAALHQNGFVDLESWVRQRAWVILRLPAGEIGREGARLTAGMVYNIFEAAYRKVTAAGPVPFVFVVDETQEIAQAMQLESLLSEGGKFGARMFVLAQSLNLLRRIEGFEPVVQSLLANSSAQLFFSPGAEDAELVRATLSAFERYGPTTIDVPSLQAWLRARVDGKWQPPALVAVEPLRAADPERVQRLLRDVAAAHPGTYVRAGGWQSGLPVGAARITEAPAEKAVPEGTSDPQRLGW